MKLRSLSIFSFDDDKKKYCARVASCIGMFLFAALIFRFANIFVNISWKYSWPRVFWGKYYQNEQNIDSVFLGSSHVFRDISPEVMDRELGGNHWNMSDSGMRLNSAYSILREVNSKHDIKNVYLELFWWCSSNEPGETDSSESYLYNSVDADYRTVNFYNLELQLTMSSPVRYLETFFPGVRYRKYLLQPSHVKEAIKYQLSESYKKNIYRYESDAGIIEYRDKGFWYTTFEMSDATRRSNKFRPVSDGAAMTASAEKYLRKIIEYCKSNEINIILFCAPVYNLTLFEAGDYDAYVNDVKKIADEYDLAYYDFNLIRPQYLDIQHLEYFSDSDHLNTKGAIYFSKLFADIIKNPGISRDMFYGSCKEKLQDCKPEVYGIYWETLKDGNKRCYVAANKMEGLAYEAFVKPYFGEPYQAEFRKSDNSFLVSGESGGNIELSFHDEKTNKTGKYIIQYYEGKGSL